MRALLLINPSAGGSSRNRADLLQRTAHLLGHTLDLIEPKSVDDTRAVTRHAVAQGYARICCSGGDGTLNLVATGLIGTGIPLGIIPTGTVNVLARELHIPLDPTAALHVALHGTVRRLDVGMANGQPFILMAGLGFDAEVVSEIVPRLKELFGPLAYVTTGLQILTRYKPSTFHIEVNGVTFTLPAWLVVVSNASYYAYQLPVTQEARMDDGLLDVCLFAERNSLDRLVQLGAIFTGQHVKHPNVSYFRARSLRISADPPVHLQLDGDPVGVSPVDISVRPQALHVITPSDEPASSR